LDIALVHLRIRPRAFRVIPVRLPAPDVHDNGVLDEVQTDVLIRSQSHPAARFDELLPQNWTTETRVVGLSWSAAVSVHAAQERRDVAYFGAHAKVEDMVRSSGMSWGVARPTGFFTAFAQFLDLAAKGACPGDRQRRGPDQSDPPR
jgi:hypothetical protein